MLKKTTHLCLWFSLTLLVLWGFLFGKVRESDLEAYHLNQMEQKDSSIKHLAKTAHQNRQGVVKEIYFAQPDGSRLHYRIESQSSQLTLKPEGSHFDLIEQLQDMRCWMQDKFVSSSQQVRYLEAAEGIYRYSAQQFLAQSVALSLYHLEGHELPRHLNHVRPFLSGMAQDVAFTITGKVPQFQAQQFKASLGKEI